MFGIGWSEMLLILAVAVLVIGPKDLPRLLYAAGKVFRKVRIFTNDIQRSLDSILHEEELSEITREANRPGGENLQFEIDRQLLLEEARRREEAAKASKADDLKEMPPE